MRFGGLSTIVPMIAELADRARHHRSTHAASWQPSPAAQSSYPVRQSSTLVGAGSSWCRGKLAEPFLQVSKIDRLRDEFRRAKLLGTAFALIVTISAHHDDR